MKTLLALLLAVPLLTAAEPAVTLTDVTYEGFDKAIAAHKGKVVVVDVWATFCAPCMKKFPHFVEMHEKHSKDGLVCVSVSTDSLEDKAAALKFLEEKKAHFPNYRLSESNEKISKELNEKYPTDNQPVMFVFDKSGKKVKQFEAKAKPEEVEAYLLELLKTK